MWQVESALGLSLGRQVMLLIATIAVDIIIKHLQKPTLCSNY